MIAPFSLHVPDTAIDDLRERLARTRLPDQTPGDPWAFGTDTGYLAGLVEHWRAGFDWRAQEAALNAFPQAMTDIDGIGVHFIHAVGVGPSPMPLLLLHGWPGSVFEFLDLIPRLTDPARYGGDPANAFTVIAPSLPGYGLSFKPGQRRIAPTAMADMMVTLMDRLGFTKFGVQGGDIGSSVATRLAYAHADRLIGIHVNLLTGVGRNPAEFPQPTEEEALYLAQLAAWQREHVGYQWIQGTRPQTLAFGLTDSPAGLAAWMVEKFRAWSGGDDGLASIDREQMLANISLYWFTGAIGSSFWPYYAGRHEPPLLPKDATIEVPVGYAEFPAEILRPPRSAAERLFRNIRRWTAMPRGGHFAALEQPGLLADDVAAFYAQLRAASGEATSAPDGA